MVIIKVAQRRLELLGSFEILATLTLGGEGSRRAAEVNQERETLRSIPSLVGAESKPLGFESPAGNAAENTDAGLALGAATIGVAASSSHAIRKKSRHSRWETQLFQEMALQLQAAYKLLMRRFSRWQQRCRSSNRSVRTQFCEDEQYFNIRRRSTPQASPNPSKFTAVSVEYFEANAKLRKILAFAVSVSDVESAQRHLTKLVLRCLLQMAQCGLDTVQSAAGGPPSLNSSH